MVIVIPFLPHLLPKFKGIIIPDVGQLPSPLQNHQNLFHRVEPLFIGLTLPVDYFHLQFAVEALETASAL